MVSQWPQLREELTLHPGPVTRNGSPTWILQDPVRNRFFRLEWPAFEILSRWEIGHPAWIAQRITAETTLLLDADDVMQLVEFLSGNQLLRVSQPEQTARLTRQAGAMQQSWFTFLLHHYLFLRIPLVKPDRFLAATLHWVRWLAGVPFVLATLLALVVALFLLMRQWDRFHTTLVDTLTWQGLFWYALAWSVVKAIHELAHAYTAKARGCRVPTMGVALMVLWPVLYTDVNETWKLPHSRERLSVAGAGILAELAVAIWATLAWAFVPEGGPSQFLFILSTTTWISSVLVNTNPFMRFDGYFLFMDWLDMPNLHGRAFALAVWRLRRILFGLADPPPEELPVGMRRFLILFAWATWIYRLVLFLGIAVMVYHFFIKAVGILLFAVEIGWFVFLPVGREMAEWRRRGPALWGTPQARRTMIGAMLFFLLFALPWYSWIAAPALWKAEGFTGLFVPVPARMVAMEARSGQLVSAGAVIYRLESPTLDLRLVQNEVSRLTTTTILQSIGFEGGLRAQTSVLREQLATAVSERLALESERQRLTITAPYDGQLVDVPPALRIGAWISPRESLGGVRMGGGGVIRAYVGEEDLERIAVGNPARFIPEAAGRPSIPCRVTAVERTPIRILPDRSLAQLYGGEILVRHKEEGLAPEGALFPVWLRQEEGDAPPLELRGTVWISGEGHSWLMRGLRSALMVVVQEWSP